jgi:2-oxo-4-hydroxy-4-carboxy-5-ureidoimidazoline decarboxylase
LSRLSFAAAISSIWIILHLVYTLEQVNQLSVTEFVQQFGRVLEHSPHYAARAAALRPFADFAALHGAFIQAMLEDDAAARLALIRAHPDLAGKAAVAGELSSESASEQKGAGLDRLTSLEYAEFMRVNTAYRAKFAMPYIVCVRENTKETILAAAPVRLANEPETEIQTALAEIAKIAKYRLQDLVQI